MFWMLNDQQLISFAESSFSRHTTTITTKLTVRATQSVWFGNMFLSDCSGFYSIQIKKLLWEILMLILGLSFLCFCQSVFVIAVRIFDNR